MYTVLGQGSIDKPLTFDVGLIQLSFIPVCLLNTCNISVKYCAEGLHFSTFHYSSGTFYNPCSSSNGQYSESDGDTGKGREEKEVASLLDRLRSPTPAEIARSRKIRSNQLYTGPPCGKWINWI